MKAEHTSEKEEMLAYMDEVEEEDELESSDAPVHPAPGTDVVVISDDKS